jgi:Ser/Thr protein kinase RdoA (MazF antagonist)
LARNVAPRLLEPLGRESTRVIRVQPTLRDARPEHFLFEGARLSGLVDFGAMGVESVAADLARLSGEWLDGDPEARREALASYERVRPLDPAESRLIDIFETTTALLIGERWVRWHYVENRSFDDPQAVLNGLERGLMRLDRLMRELNGSKGPL